MVSYYIFLTETKRYQVPKDAFYAVLDKDKFDKHNFSDYEIKMKTNDISVSKTEVWTVVANCLFKKSRDSKCTGSSELRSFFDSKENLSNLFLIFGFILLMAIILPVFAFKRSANDLRTNIKKDIKTVKFNRNSKSRSPSPERSSNYFKKMNFRRKDSK